MRKGVTRGPDHAELLGVGEQGLLDLSVSGASDVVFVREHRAPPGPFLEALESLALGLGFAVASVSLDDEHTLDALDEVVRGFAKNVRADGVEARGLVALLDAFATREKRRAGESLDAAMETWGATGDLARLCAAYVDAREQPKAELRTLRAFLAGAEPARVSAEAFSSLSVRTAKRALADLSRVVRALGHAGLLLVVRRAGSLSELSPTRRENAYTVLRELCDNADGPRGAVSLRLVVSGSDELFEGARSILESAPLATRILLSDEESATVPLPHATVLHLPGRANESDAQPARAPESTPERRGRALAAIVRASMGLPPRDHLGELTVGYASVDATLDKLFEHASNDGSVFSLLSGAYGTGKTHLLLHVTSRALAERRPVLRLSVESLDADLGNPQRHLRRLLEAAWLPGTGAPSPLDRLAVWTRNDTGSRRLRRTLEEISDGGMEASAAARRAIRASDSDGERALEVYLSGADLEQKAGSASYRQDAYGRLLLWIELLARLDGCQGPVVLIDEAENLYKGGTSRPERRTALRSLAFYCGGALPGACVMLAVTPETLDLLRDEAESMLDEVAEQVTLLAWEDVTLLRRRLLRSRPIEVARLGGDELNELVERVRSLHARARGTVRDRDFDAFVASVTKGRPTARTVVRRTISRLESSWWWGRAAHD